jgi:hypothetical protein
MVDFTLEPSGSSTVVTWEMRGRNTSVSKLLGIFIDMDRMVGTDFEAGLANLKSVVERQSQPEPVAGVFSKDN